VKSLYSLVPLTVLLILFHGSPNYRDIFSLQLLFSVTPSYSTYSLLVHLSFHIFQLSSKLQSVWFSEVLFSSHIAYYDACCSCSTSFQINDLLDKILSWHTRYRVVFKHLDWCKQLPTSAPNTS